MQPFKAAESSPPRRRRRRSRFSSAPATAKASVAQDVLPQAPSLEPRPSLPNTPRALNVPNSQLPAKRKEVQTESKLSLPAFSTSRPSAKRRRRTAQLSTAAASTGLFAGGDGSESEADSGEVKPRTALVGTSGFGQSRFQPGVQDGEPELMDVDASLHNGDEAEEDPLESYMHNMESAVLRAKRTSIGDGESSDADNDPSLDEEGNAGKRRGLAKVRPRRAVYQKVDHSKIDYSPFTKKLYIEVPELSKLTHAEVAARRRSLGNIRIRGRACPRPIDAWAQAGLSSAIQAVLERSRYEQPTPIQAQAIPAVMSGRDVIGVARTGSGKTLAFLLPVLRHIALQPRAGMGDGPAALVVAPTRELAIQIFGEARKFAKAVNIKCVCAYGGSGVKDQIAELKRGADIVICTPGRMIDLLAMNSGRITNLRRVTIVVLDEADRMFDMGFEPQLTRIVENIRPDRQTVMFSATFPVQVEKLARKVLKMPVEIMVGGNSVAPTTIDQHVEVRNEDSKFLRLLELLGKWYEVGSTLVFVDRQDNADRIFRELSKARYRCLSLHGGMDQADRDSAIVDFKNGEVKVLVATSVAARGLDVKNLTLVVNFDVPTHYEDYIHRVGRTGRAGKSGTAYTFITPEQEAYAPDLVKALELSARAVAEQEAPIGDKEVAKKASDEAAEAAVPDNLRQLAHRFELKRKAGIVKHKASSGYGGRGFSFEDNEDFDATKAAIRKMQAKEYGIEDEVGGDEGGEEEKRGVDVDRSSGSSSSSSDEDDGIVEISVAPKAGTGKDGAAGGLGERTRGGGGGGGVGGVAGGKTLTGDEVEKMLQEAVRRAEREAERRHLDADGRRGHIARAKATVLSIATMQGKRGGVGGGASGMAGGGSSGGTDRVQSEEARAAAARVAAINAKLGVGGAGAGTRVRSEGDGGGAAHDKDGNRFAGELEINDYPQHARWQVTRKDALGDVEEFTGCVITTRGNFYPAGRNAPKGERKLHFLIEGPSRRAVKTARRDIRMKLDEAAAVSRPGDAQYSKYSVV